MDTINFLCKFVKFYLGNNKVYGICNEWFMWTITNPCQDVSLQKKGGSPTNTATRDNK